MKNCTITIFNYGNMMSIIYFPKVWDTICLAAIYLYIQMLYMLLPNFLGVKVTLGTTSLFLFNLFKFQKEIITANHFSGYNQKWTLTTNDESLILDVRWCSDDFCNNDNIVFLTYFALSSKWKLIKAHAKRMLIVEIIDDDTAR